jgi:hypothetical protein
MGGIDHRRRAQPNAYLERKPSYDRATIDRIRLAFNSASLPSLSVIAKAEGRYRTRDRCGPAIHARSRPGYHTYGRSVLGTDWCWRGQASGGGSSIGGPVVSRTCGSPCAAGHREGALSDMRQRSSGKPPAAHWEPADLLAQQGTGVTIRSGAKQVSTIARDEGLI